MVKFDLEDSEDEKRLTCWICAGEVNVVGGPSVDNIYLHCPQCGAEFDRLETIEAEYLELKERFEVLLNKYEEVNSLYTTLQDHLKCLLT